MTEAIAFQDMLKRAGIGHGLRFDKEGFAVLVEADDSDDARQWSVIEFFFRNDGSLQTVNVSEGIEG